MQEWNGQNNLSPSVAIKLRTQIESFWRGRGYAGIMTWIEDIPGTKYVAVRSNIGPLGFPPKEFNLKAA